jgi:Regulatory subunit of type II PKA R-subunit
MDSNRIFMPLQIAVHPDLPGILKEFTKAVIKENPLSPEDIAAFAVDYFRKKANIVGDDLYPRRDL